MSTESAPNNQEIVYDRETLGFKSLIQRKVMELFCGPRIIDNEAYNATLTQWVENYSKDFREIFERRILSESNFRDRCKEEPDTLAKEIADEIKNK